MQSVRLKIADRRSGWARAVSAIAVLGCAAMVCGCNTDRQVAGVPDAPTDYRMRHPITLTQADRTFKLFIGPNRGSLTPSQRAEVLAFAQSWRHEATGGVIVDLPVGTSNERAANDSLREIHSVLVATGVPPESIAVRGYRVTAATLAPVRITYPKIVAQAGPCGLWPEDIGPSGNRDYFENQPPWNFGCASQRNLAAMVENPADLVQPRGETPAYAMRRTTVVEKYRTGTGSATTYSNTNAGKITTIAQ